MHAKTRRWQPGAGSTEEASPPSLKRLIARANAAWGEDDYASALLGFREVLKRHPNFPDIRNRAGVCLAMLGDPEAALQELDHAIRLNPEYTEAHLNRALVLNDMGRLDEAAESFDRARALDHRPQDDMPVDLGNRLAVEHARVGDLYLQADRPAEAVREFEKALAIRPQFVDIRSRMAQAYLLQDRVPEAVTTLEQVLAEHPTFVSARLRLGSALHRMGRTDEAVEHWRSCLEVDATNRRAQAYLSAAGVQVQEIVPGGTDGEGEDG